MLYRISTFPFILFLDLPMNISPQDCLRTLSHAASPQFCRRHYTSTGRGRRGARAGSDDGPGL